MRWSQVVFSGVGTGICLYIVTAAVNASGERRTA